MNCMTILFWNTCILMTRDLWFFAND
jgi:hypothetical protein